MSRETLSLEDRKHLLAMKHFDYGAVVMKALRIIDALEDSLNAATAERDALAKRVADLEKLNKQNAGVESQVYAGFQYTIRQLQASVASMREALDLKELSEDEPRDAQRIRELKSDRDQYKARALQAVDTLANTGLSAEQRIHEVLVIFSDTET